MIFLLFLRFCFCESNVTLHYFDENTFKLFRDSLPNNHLLITLRINTTVGSDSKIQFFTSICDNLTNLIEGSNLSFGVLPVGNKFSITKIQLYFPGENEELVNFAETSTSLFNAHTIIKRFLKIAVKHKRLEKKQKAPEIARIKEEIRQILILLKSSKKDKERTKELEADLKRLSDELIQLVPKTKQKIRQLKIEKKITPKHKRKEIEKKIKDLKKMKKSDNKKSPSPKRIERKEEKSLIRSLKAADNYIINYNFNNLVGGFFNKIKEKFISAFRRTLNKSEEL